MPHPSAQESSQTGPEQQLLLPLTLDVETDPILAVSVYEHATKVLGALTLMSQANSKSGYEWAVAHVPEVRERVVGDPAEVAGSTHKRQRVLFSAARTMLYEASGYDQLVEAGQMDQADADLQEVSQWKAFREKYMGKTNRPQREKYKRQLGAVVRSYTQDV